MAARGDKWKDTRKGIHISILGDIFKSADNCRLPIIVEGALCTLQGSHVEMTSLKALSLVTG